MGTSLLEMVENYGPIVFADAENGIVIQRNGAYLNWTVEGRDGWYHSDCRAVSRDAYTVSLADAMDSAREWYEEVMRGEEPEEEEEEEEGDDDSWEGSSQFDDDYQIAGKSPQKPEV